MAPLPSMIEPAWFWCLVIPGSIPVSQGLKTLQDFAAPAVTHSGVPEKMWAWVVERGDWTFVFHASEPRMESWTDGEQATQDALGDLEHAYWVVHHAAKKWDEVSRAKAGEHLSGQLVGRDFNGDDGVSDGSKGNPVWNFIKRETGLTLGALVSEIEYGREVPLIEKGQLVPLP